MTTTTSTSKSNKPLDSQPTFLMAYDEEGNYCEEEESKQEEGVAEESIFTIAVDQPSHSIQVTKEETEEETEEEQQGPEMNTKFQDVAATGKWGSNISKSEKYFTAALVLVVTAVLIVVSVLFTTVNRETNHESSIQEQQQSEPTMSPTFISATPQEQLDHLLDALNQNYFVSTNFLPSFANDYDPTLVFSKDTPPSYRAMVWILFEDDWDIVSESSSWLVTRYALAVLYFQCHGDSWSRQDNWMVPGVDTCQWYGVVCDRLGNRIEELDLTENNMSGQIPAELNLLQELYSLVLTSNSLTGVVPQLAIGSLPRLTILFLNDNQLEGEIKPDFRANGLLGKSLKRF